MTSITVIDEGRPTTVAATISGTRTLIPGDELQRKLGWELKPEGLCNGPACFPVSSVGDLTSNGAIDLETFARVLDRPFAQSVEHGIAVLGAAAVNRADSMESLVAPDFRLPDLDGRMHSLSEHRGRKVFLVAHASW